VEVTKTESSGWLTGQSSLFNWVTSKEKSQRGPSDQRCELNGNSIVEWFESYGSYFHKHNPTAQDFLLHPILADNLSYS
jgi:hypothetical protein